MPETPAHYVVRFKVREGLAPHVCNFGSAAAEAQRFFYKVLAPSVHIEEAELLADGTMIESVKFL